MNKLPVLINNVIVYTSGLKIDSDGSPRSYGPHNTGLDYTANAGSDGNWYGILTDNNGKPIIQTSNDPYPGMFISPTSLQDHSKPRIDPNRYVNSETVPFIAVASNLIKTYGIVLGDMAYVYNKNTGFGCGAVCADVGPRSKYGEGSIYLAQQLGVTNISPRNGGCDSDIITVIFLKSHSSWPLENDIINEVAESLLDQNGGINKFI